MFCTVSQSSVRVLQEEIGDLLLSPGGGEETGEGEGTLGRWRERGTRDIEAGPAPAALCLRGKKGEGRPGGVVVVPRGPTLLPCCTGERKELEGRPGGAPGRGDGRRPVDTDRDRRRQISAVD